MGVRVTALVALLLAVAMLAGCSEGAHDEDGDGLRDGTEKDWPGLIVDYMDRRVRLDDVTSDTKDDDTDDDGLSDFDEFFRKTDPRDVDTDDDGLTDCQETIHTVRAECEDRAYAGEYDHGYGTNPTRADSDPGPVRYVNQVGQFTDETGTLVDGRVEWGDGISDGDELNGYIAPAGEGRTRSVTSNPRDPDSDEDGLEDGEELYAALSDPTVVDTDGDSCKDGQDPWPDREELIRFGLGKFSLKRDMDLEGGADLQLVFTTGDHLTRIPATGSAEVRVGQDFDLSGYDPGPFRLEDCSMSIRFPWLAIDVLAYDSDLGTGENLDIDSLSNPEPSAGSPSGARMWLNMRTGEHAYSAQGPVMAITGFEGQDAAVTLAPTVTFRQAS